MGQGPQGWQGPASKGAQTKIAVVKRSMGGEDLTWQKQLRPQGPVLISHSSGPAARCDSASIRERERNGLALREDPTFQVWRERGFGFRLF